jgi:methionyl-tRNA formyltransferase
MQHDNTSLKFAFFGTPDIAAIALDTLAAAGFVPSLVVCNPDAPVGRKHVMTPPPTKVWAEAHGVPVLQPTTLRDREALTPLTETTWDLFVVVAYGKLMPQWLLDLPAHKTINLHPSLLPHLRGASPIRSAILHDIRETGITIMLLDAHMDHGPILAQASANIAESEWPLMGHELDERLAHLGGQLLADTIPQWITGAITPTEQDHASATFCTKIEKTMSELATDPQNLPTGNDAYDILLKIRAFDGWPETFFIYNGKRIKIKDAHLDANGQLVITRIIPEGKSEMDWNQYFRN